MAKKTKKQDSEPSIEGSALRDATVEKKEEISKKLKEEL